eukprot:Platyproteum_vivax@DN7630_c3_g3_i2.p1
MEIQNILDQKKPDIIVWKTAKKHLYIHIMELGIPFEDTFQQHLDKKLLKYTPLTHTDDNNKSITLDVTLVGSRGIPIPNAEETLSKFLMALKIKKPTANAKLILEKSLEIASTCSRIMWNKWFQKELSSPIPTPKDTLTELGYM